MRDEGRGTRDEGRPLGSGGCSSRTPYRQLAGWCISKRGYAVPTAGVPWVPAAGRLVHQGLIRGPRYADSDTLTRICSAAQAWVRCVYRGYTQLAQAGHETGAHGGAPEPALEGSTPLDSDE
jgi:hypothetical protein